MSEVTRHFFSLMDDLIKPSLDETPPQPVPVPDDEKRCAASGCMTLVSKRSNPITVDGKEVETPLCPTHSRKWKKKYETRGTSDDLAKI